MLSNPSSPCLAEASISKESAGKAGRQDLSPFLWCPPAESQSSLQMRQRDSFELNEWRMYWWDFLKPWNKTALLATCDQKSWGARDTLRRRSGKYSWVCLKGHLAVKQLRDFPSAPSWFNQFTKTVSIETGSERRWCSCMQEPQWNRVFCKKVEILVKNKEIPIALGRVP